MGVVEFVYRIQNQIHMQRNMLLFAILVKFVILLLRPYMSYYTRQIPTCAFPSLSHNENELSAQCIKYYKRGGAPVLHER